MGNMDFSARRLIGAVHLRPLPGSPAWDEAGGMKEVLGAALADARAYEAGGADAVVVENFGDLPFTKSAVPPETVAAMSAIGVRIREAIRIPVGFNVLRNDAAAGLALCAACEGAFIRVNVHTGAIVTDQGVIEGNAFHTLRSRCRLCPDVSIFADVHVKHAAPLGDIPIEIAARDTVERGGASALIVSGTGTGTEVAPDDLRRVRAACPDTPILIGSGVTAGNIGRLLESADGAIVGSSLKQDGRIGNPVDETRVREMVERMKG